LSAQGTWNTVYSELDAGAEGLGHDCILTAKTACAFGDWFLLVVRGSGTREIPSSCRLSITACFWAVVMRWKVESAILNTVMCNNGGKTEVGAASSGELEGLNKQEVRELKAEVTAESIGFRAGGFLALPTVRRSCVPPPPVHLNIHILQITLLFDFWYFVKLTYKLKHSFTAKMVLEATMIV
jgi:hypothetical protein